VYFLPIFLKANTALVLLHEIPGGMKKVYSATVAPTHGYLSSGDAGGHNSVNVVKHRGQLAF
jgi:hypothetical protein